ncbi:MULTISPECIES: hypothetical protein [unclassified Mycobacterium]|uniref:hypothetical protein n=1 Tax=unclassified Mycobacterium TaxID=2642494 RepID=UPI0025704D6F|nr:MULTISPECIES: hypothetical protein [unclassified Mycobacterium]
MSEDSSVAQARTLLIALYEHVDEVAQSMAEAEHLIRHTPRHSSPHRHHRLRVAAMRKDIYEAQRLIKQLHQRFPAIRNTVWPPTDPSGGQHG